MTYQVLARKWRPKSLNQVVGQPHVVQALTNALNQQYLHHAYLFTGTRGVGKTTLARIIAKCLNCEKGITAIPCETCINCQEIDAGRFPDLYEVDAASRTKVEDTRDLLDNIPYAPTKGRFKVYLIDEVHMLSTHSFNALLKTLEEPPAHVKFLFATTDYQRLPATILSRCLQFHLSHIAPEQISNYLQSLLNQENISNDSAATSLIAKAANGSMRDALSLLDQCIAYGNGKVLENEVKSLLGSIEPTCLYEILSAIEQQNANQVLAAVAKLQEQGANYSHVLSDLLALLHQIAVIQAVPNSVSNDTDSRLKDLAARLNREDVQLYYQIGVMGQKDLAMAPTPRIGVEMTLLRMMAFTPKVSNGVPDSLSKPQSTTPPLHNQAASQVLPWHELLPQLGLNGAALALAGLLALKNIEDASVHFILDPKHQALLQTTQIQRINDALNRYFNKTMKVTVDIGASTIETPIGLEKKNMERRKVAAEQAINNDETIQRLIQTFDATVIKDSITSLETNSKH